DDHRVDAAEFEHGLLEILTGLGADDRSGPLGPGQRYTLHARIGDDRSDLVVVGEQVRVTAVGDTGGAEDLLDKQRRTTADIGVLEHDRVAEHEVRRREAGHLVVREVPRHDAEQRTDGQGLDAGGAGNRGRDLVVRGQAGSVDAVVLDDVGGEFDLVDGLL